MKYLIEKKVTLDRKKQGKVFGFVIAFLFLILIFRLVYLQIILQNEYGELSEGNRIRLIPIKAPRGLILDRNGEIIVDNYPSYTISIIPYQFQNGKSDLVIRKLSQILKVTDKEIFNKLEKSRYRIFEPVPILKNASFEIVSQVEEQTLDLPGVIVQIEPRRRYRYGSYGSHLLGYLREISEYEYSNLKDEGYRFGDMIGKSGIEKSYEDYLRGEDGIQFEEVTALGQRLGPLPERPPIYPKPGKDLILSIDWKTQMALEEAFGEGTAGAAVAINPKNGGVLAMVSKPNFDPNDFSKGIKLEQWKQLTSDPQKPLLNRAVQSSYPPGSTFKILTAAAGLENGIITTERSFMSKSCVGGFSYGNHWFGCWKKSGHGYLNVEDAIIQSCNVYFYQLGLKLGVQKLHDFAKQCHLGIAPEIDIPVGNAGRGLVPSVEWYDNTFGKGKWSPSVVISLSIGQGEILVSSLQLSSFIAGISNHGKYYNPHIVQYIVAENGSTVNITNFQEINKFVPDKVDTTAQKFPISDEHLDLLTRAMYGVVNEPGGTARRAMIPEVDFYVAGKTGTSQNPHGDAHAWFAGFASYDDPEIAIAIIVENAGHGGGAIAAPIARKAIEAFFRVEKE